MEKITLKNGILVQGDCLEALKTLEENSIDSVVTDPPYGLSKEPDVTEVLSHWLAGDEYEHRGGGFMGKTWDSFVPGPEYWKEVYRVLKPGGHILVFSATRTWDLLSIAIRFAGFENRDTIRREHVEGEHEAIDAEGEPIDITSLAWCYGSGFPKSLNISKELDKKLGSESKVVGQRPSGGGDNFDARRSGENREDRPNTHQSGTRDILEYQTAEAQKYEGYGTALKPAWEVILVFRKPLEGTVADNVLKHGTGGLNIDSCRITTSENLNGGAYAEDGSDRYDGYENWRYKRKGGAGEFQQPSGRWPANLALGHHPDCKPLGVKKIKSDGHWTTKRDGSTTLYDGGWKNKGQDRGSLNEAVEEWNCVDGCPIKEMNQQSGVKQSGAMKHTVGAYDGASNTGLLRGNSGPHNQHGDKGGASRFFLNTPLFRYVTKASRGERELGCDDLEHKKAGEVTGGRKEGSAGLNNPRAGAGRVSGAKNFHPTVKPLDLMRWLVRLVTPPGGIVLDPFVGSGSTAMAAVLEGFGYVAMEMDPEYFPITKARVCYIEDGGLLETKPTKEKISEDLNLFDILDQ